MIVPVLALTWGWQSAFIATGLLGIVWVAFWLPLYHRPERHPRVSPAELAWIQSDPPEPATRIPWLQLLPHRQTWAFAAGKFLTDPIWWFYLFWAAKFLSRQVRRRPEAHRPPLDRHLPAGRRRLGGRRLAVVVAAQARLDAQRRAQDGAPDLCPVRRPRRGRPGRRQHVDRGAPDRLAASAHQGFSANLFTLTSDMFPRRAVGSVVGIGGMAGAIGGTLFQRAAGRITDLTGSYLTLFLIAASVYLLAVLIIHALAPRLEPVLLADSQGLSTNSLGTNSAR